jgi:hypothetical protein
MALEPLMRISRSLTRTSLSNSDFIAGMNDQRRGELRHIAVSSMCKVMRDCDDWQVRADAYDILRQLTYES